MTRRVLCAAARQELGAYVLGALAPADRSMLDQHLTSCQRCREELAALAGLPALLRRIPPADAAKLCGEPSAENSMSVDVPEQSLATGNPAKPFPLGETAAGRRVNAHGGERGPPGS